MNIFKQKIKPLSLSLFFEKKIKSVDSEFTREFATKKLQGERCDFWQSSLKIAKTMAECTLIHSCCSMTFSTQHFWRKLLHSNFP